MLGFGCYSNEPKAESTIFFGTAAIERSLLDDSRRSWLMIHRVRDPYQAALWWFRQTTLFGPFPVFGVHASHSFFYRGVVLFQRNTCRRRGRPQSKIALGAVSMQLLPQDPHFFGIPFLFPSQSRFKTNSTRTGWRFIQRYERYLDLVFPPAYDVGDLKNCLFSLEFPRNKSGFAQTLYSGCL